MINMDIVLVEFAKNNWMTVTLFIAFLKGLADISPWTWDEKVVDLIQSMLSGIKRNDKKAE